MKKTLCTFVLAASAMVAQQNQKQPPAPMTFFITSAGMGDGANLGGLAGADKHCQQLAEAAGSKGLTWRAYLSTTGPSGVNARDRIGKGPWHNFKGTRIAADLAELHGDTLDLARKGNMIMKATALTEKGTVVNGVGDSPNQHDILTGTMYDGKASTDSGDTTCKNWTSNGEGSARVGHHDRNGGGPSWNAVHASRGCSQQNLIATGGNGYFYCFAVTGN